MPARRKQPLPPAALLLTPAQTSDLTGIPLKTLERWRAERKGDGPDFVKLTENGGVMYERAVIQAWIASRTVKAGA